MCHSSQIFLNASVFKRDFIINLYPIIHWYRYQCLPLSWKLFFLLVSKSPHWVSLIIVNGTTLGHLVVSSIHARRCNGINYSFSLSTADEINGNLARAILGHLVTLWKFWPLLEMKNNSTMKGVICWQGYILLLFSSCQNILSTTSSRFSNSWNWE